MFNINFRSRRLQRSNYVFSIDDKELLYVDKYKYLGIVLDEHLLYNNTIEVLSNAGGRALGGIISKFSTLRNLGYSTYTTLFNNCVAPILDYCSAVWGFKSQRQADAVYNRAQRYFLGVHKLAPLHAVHGDMGWDMNITRWHIQMLRFWNRLIKLDDNRP